VVFARSNLLACFEEQIQDNVRLVFVAKNKLPYHGKSVNKFLHLFDMFFTEKNKYSIKLNDS